MSVGYYVQKSHVECLVPPPIELDVPFPFRDRLVMVGQQILDYSRDRDGELIQFAKALVELGET